MCHLWMKGKLPMSKEICTKWHRPHVGHHSIRRCDNFGAILNVTAIYLVVSNTIIYYLHSSIEGSTLLTRHAFARSSLSYPNYSQTSTSPISWSPQCSIKHHTFLLSNISIHENAQNVLPKNLIISWSTTNSSLRSFICFETLKTMSQEYIVLWVPSFNKWLKDVFSKNFHSPRYVICKTQRCLEQNPQCSLSADGPETHPKHFYTPLT